MFFALLYPIFGGVKLPLPLLHIMKIWKIRMGEGLRRFSFVYNLVLHVSGSLAVISMLRRKIMAVLLEGGSESHTNPIHMQKYENVDNFPKTGPMEFIFGPQLDIDKRNLFWMVDENLTSLWRHHDVIRKFHLNRWFRSFSADGSRFLHQNATTEHVFYYRVLFYSQNYVQLSIFLHSKVLAIESFVL